MLPGGAIAWMSCIMGALMGKEARYPVWYADFHSLGPFLKVLSLLSAVSLPQLCLDPESLSVVCLNNESLPSSAWGREIIRLSRL